MQVCLPHPCPPPPSPPPPRLNCKAHKVVQSSDERSDPQVCSAYLSNCTPQTPLRTLPSQRTVLVRRSNILTSPLSYPASTQRSESL